MIEETGTMRGTVCLVTGATRGIGKQTALGLARLGAHVIIVGRSPARIEETLALLRGEGRAVSAAGICVDLSSLEGVRQAARAFNESYDRLDVLVNNVGATLLRHQATADGHEMTWALNYLGHFLLTHLLLDRLKNAAQARGEARILELTSSILRLANPRFSRLHREAGYNGVMAYAQSKLAINMYTREMARRLEGTGVTINAITPGVVRTEIAGENGWLAGLAMRLLNVTALPVDQGVEPILRLAGSPDLRGVSGAYFRKYKQMAIPAAWDHPENAAHLWQMSESMSGLI